MWSFLVSIPAPEVNGISLAIAFGFLQSCFVIYFFSVKNRASQHWPVTLIALLLMIGQIESFLLRSGYMIYTLHLVNISTPLIFLYGPLLYLYVKKQTGNSISNKIKIIHFLPFVLYLGYSFNFFLQSPSYKYNAFVSDFHPEWEMIAATTNFSVDPWNIQGWIVVEILTLHILVYCIICFYHILRQIPTDHTKANRKMRYWLLYISGILTAGGIVLFFSQGGIINGEVFFKSPFPHYSADLFSTVGMYLITAYLLRNSDFIKSKSEKYKKSSLSSVFKREKLKQLKAIMDEDRPYLNPEFSLKIFSEKTGVSEHHISQILNEELQCNFYELTNRYRIREAKKQLSSAKYLKIEQLAYDLGYKSKSTFFNAFKKETNSTPSKYRDDINK